jgi:2-methylcitrate dehydratase PrpD
MAFAPKADPQALIDQLGVRYEVARTNIKKWTVGSPIQAPLDALQLIMQQHPFHRDQVTQVTVRLATSEAKTVDNREMPDISLQQMVAIMLVDGTVSFRAAHDKVRVQDSAVVRERDKVQLIADEELEHLYPQLVAIVEVRLMNGDHFTQRVDSVRGTVENPMTREEVVGKCRDLATPVLGAKKCERLIDAVLHIEQMADVRSLRGVLQQG